MNKTLRDLIKISNTTGKDSALVQGGGGNTSVKTDDGKYMYIKASGTALKDMNSKMGWRRVRLQSVLAVMQDKSIAQLDPQNREFEVSDGLLRACDDKVAGDARPSVEAPLHAFLGKCVIHLHPNAAGSYVNAKNGKTKLERLFKYEKFPPLWVPYTDPGFMLSRRIANLVGSYQNRFGQKPQILFLEKHGLFVSAKTPSLALQIVRKVIKHCNSKLKHPKAKTVKSISQEAIKDAKLCIRKALFEATGKHSMISYFYNGTIAAFLCQRHTPKMLSAGVLTPDELVYANGPALWVEKCDTEKITKKLASQIKRGQKPSAAFLVKNVGLFVAAEEKFVLTVRDVTASSLFIRTNAFRMGGILSLNKRQRDFINNWEAEAFRKKLATGSK